MFPEFAEPCPSYLFFQQISQHKFYLLNLLYHNLLNMAVNCFYYFVYIKVHIATLGILNICNVWILIRKTENFILLNFFAVKIDGSQVEV